MRYLILLSLILTACGGTSGGGKGDTAGLPPELPASCKNLYSVWTSTTDSEQWDFTSLYGGAKNLDYSFIAYDGAVCGYANNPNHNLEAEIIKTGPEVGATWDYQLNLHASLSMPGQCGTYNHSGGELYARYGTALIYMHACGEIQICTASNTVTCKTFR